MYLYFPDAPLTRRRVGLNTGIRRSGGAILPGARLVAYTFLFLGIIIIISNIICRLLQINCPKLSQRHCQLRVNLSDLMSKILASPPFARGGPIFFKSEP